MDSIQLIGFVAGALTTVSVIPQIIKTWRSKKVKDVSPFLFILMLSGVSMWAIYGFLKGDLPIIITNGISLVLNLTMLLLWVTYRKKN